MASEKTITYDVEDLSFFRGIQMGDAATAVDGPAPDFNVDFSVLGRPEDPDYTLAAFRILIFVIGILGNLLVIFIILILAEYKKAVTHWYVLQLAIADSLFLLTLPLRAAESLQEGWNYEAWTCKLKETVMFLNYYSSICFLVVMSLDRYIAVCHWRPTSMLQKLRTPLAAMIITICVWLACFVMCVPVMLYSTTKGTKPNCRCQYEFPKYKNVTADCIYVEKQVPGTKSFEECIGNRTFDFDLSKGYCLEQKTLKFTREDLNAVLSIFEETTPSPGSGDYESDGTGVVATLMPGCSYFDYAPGFLGFLWFNFIVMFIIPLIIMSLCYVMIVARLNVTRMVDESHASNKNSTGTSRTPSTSSTGRKKRKISSSKSNRNRIRVTIMCACMVILFVICWLPFHAVHLAKMKGIRRSTDYCDTLSSVVSLIAFANSMLNPIIYNFVGTRFVRRIRSVREKRSVKAFFQIASGITGGTARHTSTSGTEQNHDKSSKKQRWRSEAVGKSAHQAAFNSSTAHHKIDNGVEESYAELMTKYPVYTGSTAPLPQLSENPSKSEPRLYPELSTIISENQPLKTEEAMEQ